MDKGHQIRASMGRLLQMPCRCSDGHCFRQFQTQPTDLVALRKQLLQKDKRDVDEALHRLLQERSPPTLSNEKGRLVLLGMTVCAFAWRRLLGVGSHRYQRLQAAVANKRPAPVDARFFKKSRRIDKACPKREQIVEFLEDLYNTAAEPMPSVAPIEDEGTAAQVVRREASGSQPAGACGFAPRVGGRKCSVWTTFEGARS